jgi:hypothetical protein
MLCAQDINLLEAVLRSKKIKINSKMPIGIWVDSLEMVRRHAGLTLSGAGQ